MMPTAGAVARSGRSAMHLIATVIEVVGVGVIVVGALLASWNEAYECFRADLGRGILLGLEFLVAWRHHRDRRGCTHLLKPGCSSGDRPDPHVLELLS
jgi:Protein of unknown function (DUF1622)